MNARSLVVVMGEKHQNPCGISGSKNGPVRPVRTERLGSKVRRRRQERGRRSSPDNSLGQFDCLISGEQKLALIPLFL